MKNIVTALIASATTVLALANPATPATPAKPATAATAATPATPATAATPAAAPTADKHAKKDKAHAKADAAKVAPTKDAVK